MLYGGQQLWGQFSSFSLLLTKPAHSTAQSHWNWINFLFVIFAWKILNQFMELMLAVTAVIVYILFFLPASIIFSCNLLISGESSFYVCIAESFYAFSIYSKFTALNSNVAQYGFAHIKLKMERKIFFFFLSFSFSFSWKFSILLLFQFSCLLLFVLLMFYN